MVFLFEMNALTNHHKLIKVSIDSTAAGKAQGGKDNSPLLSPCSSTALGVSNKRVMFNTRTIPLTMISALLCRRSFLSF